MGISRREPAEEADPAPGPPPARGAARHRPAHSSRPLPPLPRFSRIATVAGAAAGVAAIAVGTAALVTAPSPTPQVGPVLQPITVSAAPAATIPLSAAELFALLDRDPQLGALDDPHRRASCLAGLGYSATTDVLAAAPIAIGDRAGVLLVLPGPEPGTVAALAVTPHCSSADTGLFADTTVRRP